MNDARDCCRHQPRQTEHSVHAVEEAAQTQVIVVRLAVLELVTLVRNEVPSDTVVQEYQDKGQNCRSSSHDGDPSLPVEVRKVNNPTAGPSGGGLFRAVIREERLARRVAAGIGGLKIFRHLKLLRLYILKDEVIDQSPDKNRHSDSKVMNRTTDAIVAEK